jgi:hypothetical protein
MKNQFHILSSSAFVVVCLLFFMPFVSLVCANQKMVVVSGTDLVTGFEMNVPDLDARSYEPVRRTGPNMFAVIALAFAVIGAALPHVQKGRPSLPTAVVTIAAIVALSLIALQVDLNSRLGTREKNLLVSIRYEPGYWLCIAVSLAAGALALVVKGRAASPEAAAPARGPEEKEG